MDSRIGGAEDPISLLSLAWFRRLHFQATHPFTEARIVKVKKTAFQLGPLICSQCSKLGEPCLLQIIQKCFHIYFTGLMPGDFWFNSTPQLTDEIIVEVWNRHSAYVA